MSCNNHFSLLELEALVQVYGLLVPCAAGTKEIIGIAGWDVVHHGWIHRSTGTGASDSVHVGEDLSQGTQPAVQLHLLGLENRVLCLHCHKVLAGYA